MSLKKLAEETTQALDAAIPADLSENERRKVLEILEQALVKSIEEATRTHHEATVVCCGPEADLAHKISEEMNRANIALVANLKALR